MSIRNVYLDCEFLPADPTTRGLVSIGMTDNLGSNFYAVNADVDVEALLGVPWMVNNVLPYLPTVADDGVPGGRALDYQDAQVISVDQIRADVAAYFNQTRASETRLYAYYGGQDIGRLHSLWDNNWEVMPDQIPQWFTELESLIVDAGRPRLPVQDGGEHHAVADARYNRQIHEALLGMRPALGETEEQLWQGRKQLLEAMSAVSEDRTCSGWAGGWARTLHAEGGIWETLGRAVGWPTGNYDQWVWVSWDEAAALYTSSGGAA